jgi:hypothetical protein
MKSRWLHIAYVYAIMVEQEHLSYGNEQGRRQGGRNPQG